MTSRELHARASDLFLKLRLRGEAQRTLALQDIDDMSLRDEVSSLLEHDEVDPPMPERIGIYRVLKRIGRGGTGQVFLAEQEEPIRRRVAVKVVPQAAVDRELAARFEVECRALERTEHPNIVRILDAGHTAEGLPYLVMDYVEGIPITDWCERQALGLTDRIKLLLEVADAVQHAHQRGVIHRDLKPANLLVAEMDGRAVTKVLDFGIASPVAGRSPALTATGLALGTPSYMAPEQTGLQAVDTRTDVYGLGAVLYELVAGQPPIELGSDPLEVLRRVRESVPVPASRTRAAAGLPPWAGARHLQTDLDCILAKALEKDPERRYPTAAALAEDLRRLLGSEPIVARPATLRYRTARFVRRHRALVAASVLLLVGLIVGVVGLSLGMDEAGRQRDEASRQRDEADRQRAEAVRQRGEADRQRSEAVRQRETQDAINSFLTDDVLAAASPYREGGDVTALELLDQASDRLGQRFPDRPLVAAAIHHTLGEAFTQLGAYERAERHLDRALALRRAHAGADAPDTVRSELAAATLMATRDRAVEAQAALAPAIARARRILGPEDPVLYASLCDQGVVLVDLDRSAEAETLLRESLAGRRRLLKAGDPQVPLTMNHLAVALEMQGRSERSLQLLREALGLAQSSPEDPRMVLIEINNNLAVHYQDHERDREAAPFLESAIDIAADLLGPDHPASLTLEANMAGLESALGDPDQAAERYQRVEERRTHLLGATAYSTLTARYGRWDAVREAKRYQEAVAGFEVLVADMSGTLTEDHWLTAQTHASLAHALVGADRLDEALQHARIAEEGLRAQFGPDHPRTTSATNVIRAIAERVEQAQGQE